jgi:hypothetical protein
MHPQQASNQDMNFDNLSCPRPHLYFVLGIFNSPALLLLEMSSLLSTLVLQVTQKPLVVLLVLVTMVTGVSVAGDGINCTCWLAIMCNHCSYDRRQWSGHWNRVLSK